MAHQPITFPLQAHDKADSLAGAYHARKRRQRGMRVRMIKGRIGDRKANPVVECED